MNYSTHQIHNILVDEGDIVMKLCFNCKHKCIAIKPLNCDVPHQDMVLAKGNIYVKCLIGNSDKIVALYRDYSHMTVGTLENMCFECFEMTFSDFMRELHR